MEQQMADTAHHHCTRPWYLRPPVWVLGVVLLGLAAFAIVEFSNRPSPAALSYSDFLAQLDAGNIVSVTFNGTQVDGKFKRPVGQAATNETAAKTIFRSQVPSVGDPTLLPELRKEHVVIDVASSSNWASWLGRLPWPLVLVLAFILVAGAIKLLRGKETTAGSTETMQQMPMMRLVSGVFGKHAQGAGGNGPAPPKA
jgi:ATP-dependent Zn protease